CQTDKDPHQILSSLPLIRNQFFYELTNVYSYLYWSFLPAPPPTPAREAPGNQSWKSNFLAIKQEGRDEQCG
ncbi:MAG TPA: hypothetical protein QGF50_05120, partial [Roseibacillus sp.]|nr:hypothetical protein [Roseibacillus sp.]